MRAARRFGGAIAIAIAPAACHWTTTPDDAGTTDAGSETVGEQCVEIGTEYCIQYINRCYPMALTDCTSNFQAQCCVGSACNKIATVSSSVVDSCKSELDGEDCNLFQNSVFPSDCQSVLSQ